jgi:hypothetical protein
MSEQLDTCRLEAVLADQRVDALMRLHHSDL